METTYFKWPDYLVLAIMLALSAAIGFYYACTGGKQRTTKEYLLADRNMHWFPVGCSLLASFVSSLTMIGLPGEIYTFGTIFMLGYISKPLGVVIGTALYLPVLKELQAISIYKYAELRYGKPLKYIAIASGLLSMLLYTALVIYGPALSIAAVTGFNIWVAVLSVALVAILYTVMGGLKAVLWTDTLQLIIMVLGIIVVLIIGTEKEGGISNVWEVNRLSGRLDMLEPEKFLDFDPRVRHNIWGITISGMLLYIEAYGYSQVSVLRVLTLKSSRDVTLAYGMTAVGTSIFGIICGLLGMVIFSHNKLCDPVSAGTIHSKDQLYPLYVMRLFGHLPGLPGLILSSIFSASLSTISSSLNSGAAIILQDFVRPCKPNITDRHAAIASKIISLVLGAVSILLVLFARYFGSGLISMGLTFAGIFGGPGFAIFSMGIFVPVVNQWSALIGYLCGAVYAAWIGFGGLIYSPYIYHYPTTTVGCNFTDANILSNLSSPVYDPNTWNPQSHYRSGVFGLYDISYTWSAAGGALVAFIVSMVASLFLSRKDDKLIEKCLLSPLLFKSCCRIPQSWRDKICDNENKDETGEKNQKDLDEQVANDNEAYENGEVTKF